MSNEGRKTTSLVHLNTKIEAINIEHMDYGGVAIAEGLFIVEGANEKVAIATPGALGTGDMYALLNWLDTEAGSVKDKQVDAFDETAPEIEQGSGGMAGIIGSGIPIGIHKKHWDLNTNYAEGRGQVVAIGAGGKPGNFNVSGSNALGGTVPYFGVIHRISEDVIWFYFESVGKLLGT
jgi:hypothetical protein